MQRAARKAALATGLAGLVALVGAGTATAAPSAPYVPGEVVVKYKDGAAAQTKSAAADRAGVRATLGAVRGIGARVLKVAGDPLSAARTLERSAAVEYAEPNYIYRATATPNDPRFGELYGINNTGQGTGTADADIDAPEAWDAAGMGGFPATGGAKIGIVDTGINRSHEDLTGRVSDCGGVNNFGISLIIIIIIGADPTIVDGKCDDDNGHGSHVAGTIGATANNGKGVAGVAFNSPLAVCKALNASGSGTLVMVANCVTWLNQKGAKVISMSLGGSSGAQSLQDAVRNATDNGSLVVAASGNGGNSALNYPAAYPEVVSVAATDNRDQKASFSTFNSDVEVAAPGVDVLSSWSDGGYRTASGTSMATPHASAVAGLIAGRNPSGGVAAWRAKLDTSVDDLGTAGRDQQFGFGRVNAAKAVSP